MEYSDSDLILALDIGTSSTRAVLYDIKRVEAVDGGTFAHKHEPDTTADGSSTLDPDELVEEAVTCAAEALAAARNDGRTVRAVGVCTFWHSILGIGADGRPTTPILLWSDRRSAPQVARLKSSPLAEGYTDRTGCPLHTSFVPGRLLHLAETEPATFARSARFVSPAEYLFARLFGDERLTCSFSMASASGLFNQRKAAWDEETLSCIPGLTAERLSPVGDTPCSGLLEPFRRRLPDLADIPWYPALGDGACSNIGCGATVPERVALMVGTSGAMRVVVPGSVPPAVPPGLWRYQIEAGRFLMGGALSNGGAVWGWLKKTLNLTEPDDAIEAAASELPPDGHGLTVLPFLSGERAPLWRDDLRATIHGLSAATTPVEIVRAHLEAVAYRFAGLRNALRPVAPQAELIGTGAGLLASPLWAQIIADALGEPIRVSSEEQASSRGAALFAREKLGVGDMDDAPTPPITATVTPNPENTALYSRAAERQERLLNALGDW
jgi:gluconokinase